MAAWSPEQWVFMLTTMVGAVSSAIVTVMNARRSAVHHQVTQQLLAEADVRLEENTAKTEQTVVQLQNNNRAVAHAEEKLENHTAELQNLVAYLQEQNAELSTRVAQAQSLLHDVRQMNIVLKTAERQQQFERDMMELQALIVQGRLPSPEEPP